MFAGRREIQFLAEFIVVNRVKYFLFSCILSRIGISIIYRRRRRRSCRSILDFKCSTAVAVARRAKSFHNNNVFGQYIFNEWPAYDDFSLESDML